MLRPNTLPSRAASKLLVVGGSRNRRGPRPFRRTVIIFHLAKAYGEGVHVPVEVIEMDPARVLGPRHQVPEEGDEAPEHGAFN